jgi:hypothetical protein
LCKNDADPKNAAFTPFLSGAVIKSVKLADNFAAKSLTRQSRIGDFVEPLPNLLP